MELEALERQTGDYGTVNKGDTVTVSDEKGEQLLKNGCWKKATKKAETATPEQEVERNDSGVSGAPVHKDATEAEIRNDEGRRLSEPKPSELVEQQTDSQKEVIEETQQKEEAQAKAEQALTDEEAGVDNDEDVKKEKATTPPATGKKEDKPAADRQTKEEKGTPQTK